MESIKKTNEFEPTLLDVLQAVQGGFQKNDTAHASLFEIQKQTLELLNERTNAIDERLSKTQRRVEDIVDVLEKTSKKIPGFDVTQLLYADK